MSDSGLNTTRPKHSRTTSITTAKNTTSHQRKPSFTYQQHQQQHGTVKTFYKQPEEHKVLYKSVSSKIRSLLNPSGPLLPHSRHGQAFGGTSKPSLLSSLFRSRVVRSIALLYVVFSIVLSLTHTWQHVTTPKSLVIKDDWVPSRTYDKDETYSLMNQMSHGLKMHKLFSKSYYDAAKNIQPFWQKATTLVDKDQVTIITSLTPETWEDLKKITTFWEGPISAILHVHDQDELRVLERDYENTPELVAHVDIHVTVVPGARFNVLMPRNAERNLARLLATTDLILDLPIGVVPATDLRKTLDKNKDRLTALLKGGDLVAIPTFKFKSTSRKDIPTDKSELVHEIKAQEIVLEDKHWKENEGPTDLESWMDATDLYPVERYEFHYEPVVIESKSVQPWCSERFLDRRAACIFTSYLEGNDIWVLPNDFMIQLPHQQQKEVSDFDNVVEDRIYAKFYWEQCVHHARQLDALGLWKTTKSAHIRNQCSRVIQNWGKGLIGKPE